jgi:transposase
MVEEVLKVEKDPGRPLRLDEEKLGKVERILKVKPYWSVKEVIRLIKELFEVSYSDNHRRKILVKNWG